MKPRLVTVIDALNHHDKCYTSVPNLSGTLIELLALSAMSVEVPQFPYAHQTSENWWVYPRATYQPRICVSPKFYPIYQLKLDHNELSLIILESGCTNYVSRQTSLIFRKFHVEIGGTNTAGVIGDMLNFLFPRHLDVNLQQHFRGNGRKGKKEMWKVMWQFAVGKT